MPEIMIKVKKREKENFLGMTEHHIKDNFIKIT